MATLVVPEILCPTSREFAFYAITGHAYVLHLEWIEIDFDQRPKSLFREKSIKTLANIRIRFNILSCFWPTLFLHPSEWQQLVPDLKRWRT